jgi:hypothetical protein
MLFTDEYRRTVNFLGDFAYSLFATQREMDFLAVCTEY